MPPPLSKKIKGRDGRRSSSRHTTPSSTISAPMASPTPTKTAFLDIPISDLAIPVNVKYEDILERHGGNGGIPDPKHLETIADNLRMLAKLAQSRTKYNDMGMRALAVKRKEALEQEREREMEARELEQQEIARKQAEEEEAAREKKNGKSKRKERSRVREEKPQDRPLNHGAHGLARQDGVNLPVKASPSAPGNRATTPLPPTTEAPGSGSSSSLSEASPVPSPSATTNAAPVAAAPTVPVDVPPPAPNQERPSTSGSSSSEDAHQPAKAASLPQYQTFGTNPLAFDDPTVYETKQITPDMTDDEKKEACAVASYPTYDLSHLIAGKPPDKDFSNGGQGNKPSNQVQAHTFASYLEPYLRPLKEEDINFLKERGDRVTPFIMPRRGTKHYRQIWAEEDGAMEIDSNKDHLNPNQGRGSVDQMNDDVAETDQVSGGPVLNRFLSMFRYEHRAPPNEDKPQPSGIQANTPQMPGALNGDPSLGTDDILNFDPFAAEEAINNPTPLMPPTDPAPGLINTTTNPFTTHQNPPPSKTLPPATYLPDSARLPGPPPHLTHSQVDDRLKLELRHLGLLGPEDEPDYDAHYDDPIAQRLRLLQARLKEVSILNGARKQRLLEIAEGQMALQEYNGIAEDLDDQVQGAYLKSLRTASRSKKNTKRPGGAGGGSHHHASTGGVGGDGGVSKPGIGDLAKKLMEKRQKWESTIGVVFSEEDRMVRGEGESIFEEEVMREYVRREKEKWEEEEGE